MTSTRPPTAAQETPTGRRWSVVGVTAVLLAGLLAGGVPSSAQQGFAAGQLLDAVIAPNVALRDGRPVEVMALRVEVDGAARCNAGSHGHAIGWLLDSDHDPATGATGGIAEGLGADVDLRFVCDGEAETWTGPLGALEVSTDGTTTLLSVTLEVADLPSVDFAYAAYADDGSDFVRLPGTGSRWTATTMARRTDGEAASVVGRDLVSTGFAQGQTSGISRTFRVRDCSFEIFRIVTPPVDDAERAAAEADIERIRATIVRALQRSDDMRTKFFEACARQGGTLEFIIYRDDADVLGGSRGGNRINVDLGDIDRLADAATGSADDVATLAEHFLLTLLAHEIDHARTPPNDGDPSTPDDNPAPADDHSDPQGEDVLTERGKPVNDENAVNEDLGTGIHRPVYAASAFPVRWLYRVGGRDVEIDPERLNGDQLPDEEEGPEDDRLGGASPPEPSGLPGRPCEEGEEPGGCYVPVGPTGGETEEEEDRDGDGVRDRLEGALGSRTDDGASVPEHWAVAGVCVDGRDGDADGFTDVADVTCRGSAPYNPFEVGLVVDAHRVDRGGVAPDTDVMRLTGTLLLDTDADGEVDEEVAVEGPVAWQRVRGEGPVRPIRPVAVELAGTSEALGPFALIEAAGPGQGGELASEDAALPALLRLVQRVALRTADGTHPAAQPLTLTAEVQTWPPVGAISEVTGVAAIGAQEVPLVTVVGGTLTVADMADAGGTAPEPPVRLGAEDPAATAAAAALAAFPDGAPTVLLARTEEFADALAGASLAGLHGGPILQTPAAALAPAAVEALEALDAQRVILLGGTAAISQTVADELTERGLEVQRLGGRTRLETMALIAAELAGAVGTASDGEDIVPTAVLATAFVFADALSAGAPAWQGRHPVVLTQPDQLSVEAEAVLTDPALGIGQVVVAGGEAAISAAVVDRLEELDLVVLRLDGPERTATAVRIGQFFAVQQGSARTTLVAAPAGSFNDALALGPLAGSRGVPLYLVDQRPGQELSGVVDRYCGAITEVVTAGLPDDAVEELLDLATC